MDALFAILPHNGGYHELRLDGERHFCDVTDFARLDRIARGAERLGAECYISAVPRIHDGDSLSLDFASVLWARLEAGKPADVLRRFPVSPTLVLREGRTVRRTALWALSRPLDYDWTVRANRRIAHRLGTRKKDGEPGAFIPVPGSVADGHRVWVEHRGEGFYEPAQVVGQLPDAPDPEAWRAAA